MFYSQTYLSRKGPLSTVWMAAHLHHRLKKSQYTTTDIPSTVEHIMDPGVPIALRMSAHLLLGVTRIYSKKVDYLLNDCNAVRSVLYKVFASVSNNMLPEDARQAPVHSITMPVTFDLDALSLGDIDINGCEDVHMRSQEEITLTDRTPIVYDNYVTISFDEDVTFGSSNTQPPPDSEARPIEEDTIFHSPSKHTVDVEDGGLSFHRESHTADHSGGDHLHRFQDPITKQVNEVEKIRDAPKDYDNTGYIPDFGYIDDTESNMDIDRNMNEKDRTPQLIEEIIVEPSPPQHAGPPTHDGASDAQVYGGQVSRSTLGLGSPNFEVLPSPVPEQQPDQMQQRGRKRKFFDDPIVLSNKFMRETLNNTRNILRKRKDVSTSALDTWKSNNSRLKEHIFDQPLFTGMSKELVNIYSREYICSKPHLVIPEEDHLDGEIPITPPINEAAEEPVDAAAEINANAFDVEVEQFRSVADAPPLTIPTQSIDTEPMNEATTYKSPVKGDFATPTSVPEMQYVPTSPSAHGFGIGTPSTYQDNTFQNYDIPNSNQLINSPERDELWFLEEENTPASSQSPNESTLSGRTSGLAQYLEVRSPDPKLPVVFSLDRILEGKTRKVAARMFYEVLVLIKNDRLDDVQQEQPYGDISFKLKPENSKRNHGSAA